MVHKSHWHEALNDAIHIDGVLTNEASGVLLKSPVKAIFDINTELNKPLLRENLTENQNSVQLP